MKRASLLSQLDNNQAELMRLEDRLSGGYGQEEGAHMLKEQETLTAERDTLTAALSAIDQGPTQENRLGLFTLNRTLSMNPKNPDSLERQCKSIAETMTHDLVQRRENGDITQDMYDNAHAAINYELQCWNVITTAEQFKAQVTADIEQALKPTSSQVSYG